MSISVGDLDTFMSHSVGNSYRGETHVDQQTDMAVSQIVDSDALDPCGFCPSIHFPVRKADGVIMGKAGIVGAEEDSELRMEIGYHIFEPYRRQGYALEACRLILDYIHEEFEAQVYAVTESSNAASKGVLAKLGFEVRETRENGEAIRHCEPMV